MPWGSGQRPTAVLAMCDAMAIGVFRAARDLGLRVPAELSVVGFDDIELARYTDPPLTTVRQHVHDKGREAVRLLLSSPARRGGSDGLANGTRDSTRHPGFDAAHPRVACGWVGERTVGARRARTIRPSDHWGGSKEGEPPGMDQWRQAH